MAAKLPDYALLGRCARARAWLADPWDPAAASLPCPPLDSAALAGTVALGRVVRFRAPAVPPAATGGPPEDPHTYLPPVEADGSGRGPVFVDYTVMDIPVEAPPLRRAWASIAGERAAPAAEQSWEAPSAVDTLVEALDGAYDEDEEVLTLYFVCDVQLDLMHVVVDKLVPIQPTARGFMHRMKGEVLSTMTAAAPPGLPPWSGY